MSGFELLGGTDAVETLRRAIQKIGSVDFRRDLLEKMSAVALQMTQDEFAMSHDPYGNPWASLKTPRFGAGPLVKTGRMQGGLRRKVIGDGFTLRTPARYATYHQTGTRKMVARPIFPTGELPDAWLSAFDRIAEEAINRALSASL